MVLTVFQEDVVQAILDYLAANLPAQLDATWAKYAASDTAAGRVVPNVKPPASGYLFGPRLNSGLDRPLLWAYAPTQTLAQFGTANSNNGWAEYEGVVLVEVLLTSDLEETVERMYARYAEAIFQVLYKNQGLGGLATSVVPRRVQREKITVATQRTLIWELVVRVEPEF